MPAHRNQHFVPRAHLRPFSVDGEGRAIHLHLVGAGRAVFGAPVRSQCARPYLYGRDGRLERMLAGLEERYAGLVRRVVDGDGRLDDEDGWLLRYFTLLQSLRTAEQIDRGLAQASEMAAFFRAAEEAHGQPWEAREPDREAAMTNLMLAFAEQMQEGVLDDLKVVLVRNRTARGFVTSDDPAATTNRWLLQRRRVTSFGSNAAGLVLILPLGPRLLAMTYDPAVYSLPVAGRAGPVDLEREDDVFAFNAHQYMRAAEAVYFSRAGDAPLVAAEFEAVRPYRPSAWETFTVAARDGGTGTHDRFTVGEPLDVAKADRILYRAAREWPVPPRWPSILKYRADAHGFTKGRIVVRRARVEGGPRAVATYRKVR